MKKILYSMTLLMSLSCAARPDKELIQYSLALDNGYSNQGQTYMGNWEKSTKSVAEAIQQGMPSTLAEWEQQGVGNVMEATLQLYPNSYSTKDGKIRPFLSVPIKFENGNIKQNGNVSLKKI